MSPGASSPGTPKSLQKVLGTLQKQTLFGDREVSGESPKSVCFWSVPRTFWRLFGVPGPPALGDIFETLSAFWALKARETSVRGGLVPNERERIT